MTRQSSKKELVREVVDTNDVVWRVREVRLWNSAGKQVTSLIAERAGGFRKLWSYPSDWAELNDLELGSLINDPVPMAAPARMPDPTDEERELALAAPDGVPGTTVESAIEAAGSIEGVEPAAAAPNEDVPAAPPEVE